MISAPEIAVDYSLSYREFVAGQKLAVRQHPLVLLFHIFARYVAVTVAAVLVLMALVNIAGDHARTVIPVLPLIFIFLLIPVTIWMSWRYSYKRLKLAPSQDPLMTFQADANSFARQIHGMGELTWLWSATQGVADNEKVVIIAARKGAYIIIPRRAVNDAQIARMKQMLRENKGH